MSCPDAEGKDERACRSESVTARQRFTRACRLTARRQFTAVYEKGRRTSSSSFTVFGLPNGADHCRLGVTVTRKVGGSVQRNRIKRVLRDIFRRHRENFKLPLDLVVNARPGAERVPTVVLEAEFVKAVAELSRRYRK